MTLGHNMIRQLNESWGIIVDYLAQNMPSIAETLNPGATAMEIDHLKDKIPHAPRDLVSLLQINNGQKGEPQEVALFDYMKLYSAHEIVEHLEMNLDVYDTVPHPSNYSKEHNPVNSVRIDKPWNNKWVPFMGTPGQELFLDNDPTDSGTMGQVVSCNYTVVSEPRFESLTEFLSQFSYALEGGKAKYVDGAIEMRGFLFDE